MHAIQVPKSISSVHEYGSAALTLASDKGHIKIVQALLTAPGIDVNHAKVSIYLLTPFHAVVKS